MNNPDNTRYTVLVHYQDRTTSTHIIWARSESAARIGAMDSTDRPGVVAAEVILVEENAC